MKCTEVKLLINDSTSPVVVLVPIEASPYSVIQSIKSKSKDTIELLASKGDLPKAMEKINKLGTSYNNLIKGYLAEAFPGMKLRYTENNLLMSFRLTDVEPYQVWFEINSDTTEEESDLAICE